MSNVTKASAAWCSREGPVRKTPSSLFTMAVSPGTVALAACGLLPSTSLGFTWVRIVESNGTNSLAPSCGPDSGNYINNSREGRAPERPHFRGSRKQLKRAKTGGNDYIATWLLVSLP